MSSLYIRPATLALVISTAYVIIYALSYAGINIPIVRQVLGLALIFMPGYFAARLLGLRGVESLLISVGLALSLVMFAGAATNFIYPMLGITKPLVGPPVVITLLILVATLALAHYIKYPREYIQLGGVVREFSLPTMLILSLPLWSVVGVSLVTAYGVNTILMAQVAFFAVIPILIALGILPQRLYPATLWAIALSLTFQNSLPTLYPRNSDGLGDQNLLKLHGGIWNPELWGNTSVMLSVLVFIPMLSEAVGLSLNWVYKLIVPLINSTVPVILYYAYKRLASSDIAFLSAYFYMSFYIYYTWSGVTFKVVSSMLFFSLILLLVAYSEALDKFRRVLLAIIFGVSIPVSHYGMGYIFTFYTLATFFTFLILTLFRERPKIFSLTFITTYTAFLLFWYTQIGGGAAFSHMINIANGVLNEFIRLRLFPHGAYATEILTSHISLTLEVLKILSGLFIAMAVLIVLVYLFRRGGVNREFLALAIASIPVGAAPFAGGWSSTVTPDRIFQIVAPVFAPYAVMAITKVGSILKRGATRVGLITTAVLLAVYLLVNTGFVAEILGEFPGSSLPLSMGRIESSGTMLEVAYLYLHYVPYCDVVGGLWLSEYKGEKKIYADGPGLLVLRMTAYGVEIDAQSTAAIPNHINIEGYIYLRRLNHMYTAAFVNAIPLRYFYLNTTLLVNKIYDNGCSAVYIR